MSVEERHLLLNGQVEMGGQSSGFVRPQTNRPPPPPSREQQHNLVSIESSDNSDEEEEDEILKSIIEQSKKETRMTEEEKTKLVLLESLKEVNLNDKSLRESKEGYERKMRELLEKDERQKDEKRIKLDDDHMIDADQKKREQEELEQAIKESLGMKVQVDAEGMSVDIEPPPPPAFSGTPPPSPARPTSLPGPVPTQLDSGHNMDRTGSNFKVVQKSEANLGAVPRRRHTSIPNPQTQNPLAPANNNPDFPPTLGDEDAQLAWALEASKPQKRPSSTVVDGASGGIPDEDEQLAWALEASQPKEPPKERHDSGSAGPDLMSVLTPEEQMELAMRLSQPSRTPTALGSNSPMRSSSAHRIHPAAPSSSPHRMSPAPQPKHEGLRLIVIDGCNVAMAHGLHRNFSVRGLVLAYEHFREKGHQVAIFLPRKNWTHASPEDKAILTALEQTEILFLVQNLAYDDKMIIRYANEKKGIVLSNDRYRDVLLTNPELEDQIKNRTLKFTWVHDTLMIAEDPFGRYGPSLHKLLRF